MFAQLNTFTFADKLTHSHYYDETHTHTHGANPGLIRVIANGGNTRHNKALTRYSMSSKEATKSV